MRKVAYRTSNNKNEKHVNKNEILLKAVKNKDSDEIHVMCVPIWFVVMI